MVEYFRDWLERDGYPFWSLWDNVRSWLAVRDLPNVMLVHFADLKADMPAEIRKIAAFLDIPIDETRFETIIRHCSFDYMKANATASVPLGGAFWDGGAETFINKGQNGRWRDMLPPEDSAAYEKKAAAELGEACAAWLAGGDRSQA